MVAPDCGLPYSDLRYAVNSVHIDRSSTELYGCVIEDFSSSGFFIDGYDTNPSIPTIIEDCVVRQNDANLLGTGTGIYVYRSADVTVSGGEVSSCLYGVYFLGQGTYAPHFQVSRCKVLDNASRGISALAGG